MVAHFLTFLQVVEVSFSRGTRGLKLGEVVPSPLYTPHPYDALKVCDRLIDFNGQKGVPFAGEHPESTACKGGLK